MRSGTTWLYEILKSHSDIYLCSYKKETHFFTQQYGRGIQWYSTFFPKLTETNYKIIAEIAPTYITHKNAPERIKKYTPNARFIVILRNPVTRLISDYKYEIMKLNIKKNLFYYLKYKSYAFERGLYAKDLTNWFKTFPKEKFLILIFEELMADKIQYLKKISEFLDLNFNRFKLLDIEQKVNTSESPKLHKPYLLAYKINKKLKSKGLYKVVGLMKRFLPLFYLFGKKESDTISQDQKVILYNKYKASIEDLELLLGRELNIWKQF